ncbi:hypothetical protein KAU33_16020 [Candidatus Dependentiae bacterium]|nr:hypothetical protein [Candidatus Dependentiae bacterium]
MAEKKFKIPEYRIKREICPGCNQDRYNHKGMCERPGIDAPVTCERCWHMTPDNIQYDRRWKRYYCEAGDNDLCYESQETVRLGKKMIMHYNGYLVEVQVVRG